MGQKWHWESSSDLNLTAMGPLTCAKHLPSLIFEETCAVFVLSLQSRPTSTISGSAETVIANAPISGDPILKEFEVVKPKTEVRDISIAD
jgi:hypothetical protein